ncbi:MAG: DUF5320 domain-containing protein [Candidatus Thorarchaeota archaeon]
MPWGDRTGPRGFGSRTGRGLGYCSGYSTPGYTKGPGMGMGWGRGRGGGWGRGRGGRWGGWGGYYLAPNYDFPETVPPYPPVPIMPDPQEESKYLENVVKGLRKEIEAIEKRLTELATKKKD